MAEGKSKEEVAAVIESAGADVCGLEQWRCSGSILIAEAHVIGTRGQRFGTLQDQADLEYMLTLVPQTDRAQPSIHRTVAVADRGVVELVTALDGFVAGTAESRRQQRRRERAEARFVALLGERILARVREEAFPADTFARVVAEIAGRRLDPYTAAKQVLDRLEVV